MKMVAKHWKTYLVAMVLLHALIGCKEPPTMPADAPGFSCANSYEQGCAIKVCDNGADKPGPPPLIMFTIIVCEDPK